MGKTILLAAVVTAVFSAAPAVAQTTPAAPAASAASSCGPVAPAPSLPDGATATREVMDQTNLTYTAWFTANRDALECRRAEFEALAARTQALRTEFNAGAEALNATNTAWQAEVAEFNARSGRPQTTRDIPPTRDAPPSMNPQN
jgi:hypothetical protein